MGGVPMRIESVESFSDFIRCDVVVPADCAFFDGHLPSDPILPGAAQLLAVSQAIHLALGPTRIDGVRHVRFRSPVRPGDRLDLRLSRLAASQEVEFFFRRGAELVSSGSVLLG
jgi:3-hydroxymyristoyl/3-hydroxydecanoyl-(acyl carrier protein) dehydratase